MNLAENLERTARARGRSAALTAGDRVTTFGELDRDSRRVAGFLAARGVRPGDHVGVVVPNVPEFAALYYGILRLGAVVVPINPLLGQREISSTSRTRACGSWWPGRRPATRSGRRHAPWVPRSSCSGPGASGAGG